MATGRARALLALVRWPGAVTAAGNAVTSFLLAHEPHSPGGRTAAAGAVAAALLVYAGGVALNDVADAEKDRTAHPARPIPSGAVPRTHALWFGISLLAAGVAAAAALANAGAALLAAAAAVSAVLYDVAGPRSRVAGTAFLAAARGANAAMGAAAALGGAGALAEPASFPRLALVHAIAVAGYTALLTWTSTLEDRPVRRAEPAVCAILLAVAAAAAWPLFPRVNWPESPAVPFVLLAATLLMAAREAAEGTSAHPPNGTSAPREPPQGGPPARPRGPGMGAVVRAGVFGFLLADAAWLFGCGRAQAGFYLLLAYFALRLALLRARS